MAGTGVWVSDEQQTIPALLEHRLETDPEGEYLDVTGTKLTAADVQRTSNRLANALSELGLRQGDRGATLIENSPNALLSWWGAIRGGFVAVPVNTAYKGEYLRHQLADSGSRVLSVEADLADRASRVVADLPDLDHVVGVGGAAPSMAVVKVHTWDELLQADNARPAPVARASDLATFVYTGGTTGPSKGCML